jgi:hypothetical protein
MPAGDDVDLQIDEHLGQLAGSQCWTVIGDHRSDVHIGFGSKVRRNKPLSNDALSDEERQLAGTGHLDQVFLAPTVITVTSGRAYSPLLALIPHARSDPRDHSRPFAQAVAACLLTRVCLAAR